MCAERVKHQYDGSVLSIDEVIRTHRFVRTLETARENGVALLLARQLVPLLQHHFKKYGAITPAKLEGLIGEAAQALIEEPHT